MIRKTLTILSLIGLLLSVGLWGVSYLHIAYAPATLIHKFKLSDGKFWFVQLRNSVGDVHDVAQEILRNRPGTQPCAEIGSYREEAGTVTFAGWFFAPGFVLNDSKLTVSDIHMYDAKYAPRCTSTPERLVVGTPLYLPTLIFAVYPAYRLLPIRRRRTRKKLGLCVKCGYDLRASKDICPECGEEFGTTDP